MTVWVNIVHLVSALLILAIVMRYRKAWRRSCYERDCYRTALQVLESNGYFDHKAEELVRQHTPE